MNADRLWGFGRVALDVLIFGVALWMFLRALSFRPLAAYFPATAAGLTALLVGIQAIVDVRNLITGKPVLVRGVDVDSAVYEMGATGLKRALRYLGWFVAYTLLLYVTGPLVSGPVFVAAFVRIEGDWTWRGTLIAAAGVAVATIVTISGLGLQAPDAMLEIGYELF